MNTIIWLVLVLVLGLATGKVVGALTAFTGGPAVYDLPAGGLGALAGAGLLRLLGPMSYRAPLITVLTGVAVAFLATWLTRLVTWPPEPPLLRPDDAAPDASADRLRHDLMTTSEGSRLLLTQGHLVAVIDDAETEAQVVSVSSTPPS